jgi:hypothetical protein
MKPSGNSKVAGSGAVERVLHLSEDDRARIRAEEIFRSEVRSQLESGSQPSRGARLLKFLNQSFILWLLSTVVVGLISWQYTRWEERQSQQRQTQTEIRNLDLEIHGRLRRAADRLSSARNMVGVSEAIRMLDQPSGMFVELGQRNMENLLVSLIWLMPEGQTASLEAARTGYQDLQRIAAQPEESQDVSQTIKLVRTKYLDGAFAIRHWRR